MAIETWIGWAIVVALVGGGGLAAVSGFSTICARKQELKMPHWRNLLRLSADLHDFGEIQAIDATRLDRIAASQHYANRTNYTFKVVKTTALIDCKTGSILDIHCSMKQPADSRIGWQVLQLKLDRLTKVTADKAYDWWLLRQKPRAESVEPVIKHREFDWHGVASNVLLDDTMIISDRTSNRRSSRFDSDSATRSELEPGSASSAKSYSTPPSETSNLRLDPQTRDFKPLYVAVVSESVPQLEGTQSTDDDSKHWSEEIDATHD